MMDLELIKRIKQKVATVTVIGLGHVGLITATMFAKAGFKVTGVDVKPDVVEAVSSGRSHIREAGLEKLIQEVLSSGKLTVTTDICKSLAQSEVDIICVQTPLTENKQPDRSHLQKACADIARSLSKGRLVIVESSVPPGTTRDVVVNMLEKKSKLKCGRDFWVAHCPERILVGNAARDWAQNARIVGGYDEKSTEIAATLFRTVTKGQVFTTDCATAEVAKLAENSFRDVNISFANELALICEEIGVDVIDALKLANTHPRVNIHRPGCGVGGPCIPKDPHLLLAAVGNQDKRLKLMLSSRELNEYMPEHTVSLIIDALKKAGKDLKASKIAILGATYKGETDDVRSSPCEKMVQKLLNLGAKVVVFDPYTTETFGAARASDLSKALKWTDCAVMATDHEVFKKLELKELKGLMNRKPVIVDGRRLIDPMKANKLGFRYVGVGRGS